jgi:hypothetical protein
MGGNNPNNPNNPYNSNNPNNPNNPYNIYGQPNNPLDRSIIPQALESVTTNQQVLYALATGTGGFTIFNTNDFAEGLAKVAKDLDEYYVLGYVPPSTIHDGSFHRITVKPDRKGITIRTRNGYYDVKGTDLLAGKPEGKVLEEKAKSAESGDIPGSLSTSYFYNAASVARVNLALDIPGSSLNFEKLKGQFECQVNILGLAYREDGSVAARFSDTRKLEADKKAEKAWAKGTFPYQNTFDIAPGKYNLKVVLSTGGEKFGKYLNPLVIEPFNGKQFFLSGVVISDKVIPASQLAANVDASLLEEKTPLVATTAQGSVQVIPTASNHFRRGESVGLYVEVYEPLPVDSFLLVGLLYNVVDRKTNQQVFSSNTIPVNGFAQKGNPVISVAIPLPVDKLQAGDYRLEVRARDSMGQASPIHSANFDLE